MMPTLVKAVIHYVEFQVRGSFEETFNNLTEAQKELSSKVNTFMSAVSDYYSDYPDHLALAKANAPDHFYIVVTDSTGKEYLYED